MYFGRKKSMRLRLQAWFRLRSEAFDGRIRRRLGEAANDNGAARARRAMQPNAMGNYLILLTVMLGIALFYWLAISFVDWNRLLTCLSYGKRNCVPAIELNRQ